MRFPGFEDEWEKKKLGEIGEVKMCRRIFNDETSQIGDIPFFKIGSFGREADAFISKELYSDYKTRFSFPKKGDILISAAGTIGRTVVYNGEDAYFQDSNIVWIDNDNINIANEFLYYILQIVKYNTEGGTIQRLYNNILKSTRFSSPSIQEQEKISSFLSLIDERIQTQNKIIEQLETLIIDFRNQIFKQKRRFKNSNGNAFPNWEITKLGEISGKRNLKNKGLNIKAVFSNSASLGIINQTDFFDKEIANQNNINSYYIVEKDDFIYNPRISKEAPVGPISRNKIGTGVMSPLYMVLRFKEGSVDFFEQFFKSNVWHEHMESIANYGARADRMSFSNRDFFDMPIPIPSIDEQNKIANFICQLEQKNEIEKEILKNYKTQKQFLLKNLFI